MKKKMKSVHISEELHAKLRDNNLMIRHFVNVAILEKIARDVKPKELKR